MTKMEACDNNENAVQGIQFNNQMRNAIAFEENLIKVRC